MDESTYEVLVKMNKGLMWFCMGCESDARENFKDVERIKEENNETRKELKEARETNELVMKRMDELNDKHHHHHHHIQPLLVHYRTKAFHNILHLSLSDVSELQLGPMNALISSLHLTLCLP